MKFMQPQDFQEELDKNEAAKKAEEKDAAPLKSIERAKAEVIDAMVQSTKANMKHRENTTTKVDVQNPIAETGDVNRAIEAINNLAVLMLSQGQKGSVNLVDGTDLGERLGALGDTLTQLLTAVRDDTKQDAAADALGQKLDSLISQLKTLQVAPDPDMKKSLANVEQALKGLDVKPQVNVPAPKVTVQGKDVDLTPLISLLNDIKEVLGKPEVEDNSDIVSGLSQVQSAIENLSFPVPNYVLPFKDGTGAATQKQITLQSDRLFERVSNTDGASTAFTSFAATTGKKNYVNGYSITNTSVTNGYVDFRDGTGGAVLWTVPIPANGGANVMMADPIFWGSTNTALAYDVSGSLTTVYISITGYQQ